MNREKDLKFRKLVPIYRQDYDRFAQLEAKHRDIIAPTTQWPRLSGNTVLDYAPFTIKSKRYDHHRHSMIRVPGTIENMTGRASRQIVHNTWEFFMQVFKIFQDNTISYRKAISFLVHPNLYAGDMLIKLERERAKMSSG